MHYLKLLAALTALSISSTSATCFNSGAWWWGEDDAKAKLNDACHALDGTYKAREVYSVCRNSPWNQKYIFEVNNQNGHAVSLSYTACVANLKRQIDHCARGGYEVFGGVRFNWQSERHWTMRCIASVQMGGGELAVSKGLKHTFV
ncbi:MAG: hypothetical protein Q9208_004372 [Pyrenodesmia sp. 3 TL-2023]